MQFAQIALSRMAKHQLSKSAFDRLKAEFDDLTTRGRIDVAYKIERARELGDLKENGDYHTKAYARLPSPDLKLWVPV